MKKKAIKKKVAKKYTYGVYVIELNNDPMHVYVGYTSKLDFSERLKQHNSGNNFYKGKKISARVFRRGARGVLRPDLYRRYYRRSTKEKAQALELKVAHKLERKGYKVEYGI